MGIKTKEGDKDKIPGPGEYDSDATKAVHKSMPAYS